MSVRREFGGEYDETMFLQYPFRLDDREAGRQNVNGEVKISEAFSENFYNIFVKYCASQGFRYISDLKYFDFATLKKVPGVGKKKIDNIIIRFKKFSKLSVKTSSGGTEDIVGTMFDEIDESILDLNVECLNALGVKLHVLHTLENNGYMYLRDLKGVSRKRLEDIVCRGNMKKFNSIQRELGENLEGLFEIVLKNLSDREEYKMFLKRAKGFTLQEIANERGITRERVRQVIKNFNFKVSPFVNLLVRQLMDRQGYVRTQELLDIYDDDNYGKILVSLCIKNKQLEYLDFADVFVAKREDGRSTEDVIFQIAAEFVGDGKDLYKNLEELETIMIDSGFSYVRYGEFVNLIQKHGYRLYGYFAVRGKQSYGYLCSRLVAREFPKGIKLYESRDLDKLREIALGEYGNLGLPESNRALSARISNFLVLCGRGMATAEENVHVNVSVVNEIEEYIDRSEESVIFYTELFSKFEKILRMTSNVNNYNFLHGVLMMYYPDKYDYFKDYLQKKSAGGASGSLAKRIKKFIIMKNKPVSKNELKGKFAGFSDTMIIRAISADRDLFQWEYNYYSCIQIVDIDDSVINCLRSIIRHIMDKNNGYCSEGMLYETAKELLRDFMDVNNIVFPINLFYICAYLFNDLYDFRRPHIGQKGMLHGMSTKNIVMHMLDSTDRISFRKYSLAAERFKWSAATAASVFADIENDYMRVSYDMYVRKDLFDIDDDIIHKVEGRLAKSMEINVLPLINFNEWNELPDIRGYEWNVFLLNSIICNFGYDLKVIDPRVKDRRYHKGIVVYRNSGFTEYSEVIAYLLRKNGMTKLSESSMLSFMISSGLTYKVIPKELYNAGCINYIDGKFVVKSAK